MYDTTEYNSTLLDSLAPMSTVESSDVFQFDGYGLQNSNIITQNIDYSTGPTREIETNNVPRAHGDFLNDEQFRKRTITLTGFIKADTAADLEALIDTMKKRLAPRNGNLDIQRTVMVAGVETQVTERFVATLKTPNLLFAERKGYHVTFCPFKAEFLCLDPFGYDPDYTAIDLLGQTDSSINQTVTNAGTADAELTMIINFTDAVGVTGILIENATTEEQMELVGTFSAGDVVEVNTSEKIVEKNGVSMDYNGQFFSLNAGDNLISLNFTSTSQVYDVTYKHKDAYL